MHLYDIYVIAFSHLGDSQYYYHVMHEKARVEVGKAVLR